MLRTPGSGAMRAIRGLVCALAGLLLGLLAHVLAEGHLPGPVALVFVLAVLTLVGVALADVERGFTFIATVLGGAQLFLHLVFSFGSPYSWAAAGGDSAGHPSGHGSTGDFPVGGAAVGAEAPESTLSAWLLGMTLGHVLATLVTAALLAYGERALWRLTGLVVPLLWSRLRIAPVAVVARPCPEPMALSPLHEVLLARCVPRRGPPGDAVA